MRKRFLVLLDAVMMSVLLKGTAIPQEAPVPLEENLRLPEHEGHLTKVKDWIEKEPDADYAHASASAREAFRDMKYGVRIHWGIYSIWAQPGESWTFLRMSDEKRQDYQELYRTFNPTGFDAEEWMELFKRVGLKCFAFTSKHHEGFSMFDTQTRVKQRVLWTAPGGPRLEECDLAYSIMDTPFKRDIVGELCEAAHRHGIKIDLYFSHPDWYDADFRPYNYHPLQTPDARAHPETYGNAPTERPTWVPDPSPAEVDRMLQRHRTQLTELLSNYGKIDMMCLDQWMGPTIWPQMKETLKMLRTIQPDVMFRARGIGNYGDYYTPEGFVPGNPENTDMPWMVIYPLGRSFSYESEAQCHKSGVWIIRALVESVAKGGNFMIGIGPDATGRFHPEAIKSLEEAGAWLKVNGEAIYATRPWTRWEEGSGIRFTRSKDGQWVYLISMFWPGETLSSKVLSPVKGSQITMLGVDQPLKWRIDKEDGLIIKLPKDLAKEENRPCSMAWVFKIRQGEGD